MKACVFPEASRDVPTTTPELLMPFASLRAPSVPRSWRACFTSAGVRFGRIALSRAAAPETCGAAIDVPDMY